jgi:hypothetical protein
MRRSIRSIFIAAVLALTVFSASTAFAKPAEWQSVDVALHNEQGGGIMMISGELPASATLPAEAELSLPAGGEPQWIGEILGGETANDPALKYTKVTVGGNDIYRFTLTKSRIAQVELPVTQPPAFDGTTYATALKWTASQAVPSVRISVSVPAGSKVVSAAPGATLQPADGESYYSKTVKNVKAGDQLDLTFGYTVPVAPVSAAAEGAAAGSSGMVAQFVIIAVLLGAAVLLIVGVSRKMKGARSAGSVEHDNHGADHVGQSRNSGSSEVKPRMTGARRRTVITVAVVAVVVVVAVIAGRQGSKPTMTGDTVTRTFSQQAPCATANIALTVPTGADPMKTAEQLFSAVSQVKGVTHATYNAKTSSLEIGYCESSSSEAALKQILAPTGFVGQGTAPSGS